MLDQASVSVIVPTYNRAELLSEAIESIAAQTVPASEIVVVDDGSVDLTAVMLADWASRLSNLKVVTIEHTPLVGLVRNAGVAASSGSILAFLDSDDLWLPRRIETQIATWRKEPNAGLAFSNLLRFSSPGVKPGRQYLPSHAVYSGRILGHLLTEPLVVPSTMMVKRDIFGKYGPFTAGPIVEDFEFVLEVAANHEISYVAEPLVLMREHRGARARSRVELANLEYLRIVQDFLKRHPDISPFEKSQARQGIANVHLKLARFYVEAGNLQSARHHVRAVAAVRPWDRRLPSALLCVLRPWSVRSQRKA